MKNSTSMNFSRNSSYLVFAIAFLAMASLQHALAQEEPQATEEAAAAEASTEQAAAADPTAGELTPEAAPAPASTLERIRANGTIRFGYRADARPFSYHHESGVAAGYSVALCGLVADAVKAKLGLASLDVEWVEVSLDDRFSDVQEGKVDAVCGADTATLARRENVNFSQPIFPGGIGALVRDDSPARLKAVLEGRPLPNQPVWRGFPAQVLEYKTFAAVGGSTAEAWLTERIRTLGILATAAPVENYEAGIESVLNGTSDVLFGDRAILLDAAKRSSGAADLDVLDRQFTVEPIALTLPRDDDDFRLVVDRAISEIFGAPGFGGFYSETFGEPDERALLFFQMNRLPE